MLGTCPSTGRYVLARSGLYGPYVQLGLDDEPDFKRVPMRKVWGLGARGGVGEELWGGNRCGVQGVDGLDLGAAGFAVGGGCGGVGVGVGAPYRTWCPTHMHACALSRRPGLTALLRLG